MLTRTKKNNVLLIILVIGAGIVVTLYFFYSFLGVDIVSPPEKKDEPIKIFSYSSLTGEAIESTKLDISGCVLNPQILKLDVDASIIIENNSSDYLTLFILTSNKAKEGELSSYISRSFAPNSSDTLQIDFKDGKGRYIYNCLGPKGFTPGIIEVFEKVSA